MITEKVKLAEIRRDGGTQPRATINYDIIEEYKEAYSIGARLPPPIVFYDGENYWLADGFHRHSAFAVTGLDEMECEVRQGTLADAVWYSCSANQSHGLRRTNSDKRRAVCAALEHPKSKGLSDSAIAEHCGVSHPTVANIRKEICPETKEETRKGKDGREQKPSSENRSKAAKKRKKKKESTNNNPSPSSSREGDSPQEATPISELNRVKEFFSASFQEAELLATVDRAELKKWLLNWLERY